MDHCVFIHTNHKQIVGALVAANHTLEGGNQTTAAILGCLALVLATINCVGGFMVTGRMLAMFRKKD